MKILLMVDIFRNLCDKCIGENVMEKAKAVLKEIHLYTNKVEMFIKLCIWIISWMGGILSIYDSKTKEGVASAYFIFSLSLLMEFASKIGEKELFISKIVHTIFCSFITGVFFISGAILLGRELGNGWYTFLFYLTVVIIVCMVIDCVILWLSKEEEMQVKNDSSDTMAENKVKVFEEKLKNGNLGSLEKEEK